MSLKNKSSVMQSMFSSFEKKPVRLDIAVYGGAGKKCEFTERNGTPLDREKPRVLVLVTTQSYLGHAADARLDPNARPTTYIGTALFSTNSLYLSCSRAVPGVLRVL